MSLKKAYIVFWIFSGLSMVLLLPVVFLNIIFKIAFFSAGYMIFASFTAFFCIIGALLIAVLFFKCPYCGRKLYYSGAGGRSIKVYNPWKGCPHCGHDLD